MADEEHDSGHPGDRVVAAHEWVEQEPDEALGDRALVDEQLRATHEPVRDGNVERLVREVDAVVEP